MDKVHMRQKRLANKKKNEIMTKERGDKNTYEEVESRKQKSIASWYQGLCLLEQGLQLPFSWYN